MGQGQAEEALRLLRECARTGDWLCLKNLHLVVSWLPTLEKEVYALDAHPEFRLFFTSEPHDKFPSSLLEGCLKVTYEAPPGLKRNVSRTYEAWSPQYVAEALAAPRQVAVPARVVPRRRAGAPRVRAAGLVQVSRVLLRRPAQRRRHYRPGVRERPDAAVVAAARLLERAIYGGRVDSAYDIIVLRTYLKQFFSAEMTGGGGVRVRALPGTDIALPQTANHGEFVALLRQLDEANSPRLFSLPVNVDRTVQVADSEHVIASLRAMAAAAGTSLGFDREAWSVALAPLLRVKRLIGAHPELRERTTGAVGGIDRAGGRVRGSRACAGRWLSRRWTSSLSTLTRVLAGSELLTPATRAAGKLLMEGAVPPSWEKHWEGPEEPVAYCKAVVARGCSR